MNDSLSEIRELAAQFASGRLRPGWQEREKERVLDAGLIAELEDLGFSGLLVPEAHGGLGLDAPVLVAVIEELAWGEPALAVAVGAAAALAGALRDTPAAGALADVAAGRTPVWAQLSHAARHATGLKAVRDGERWQLDGPATWALDTGPTGILPLVAETDPGPALFLVPVDAQGFQVKSRLDTIGLRSARIVNVHMDAVELPASALVADAADVGAVLVRLETFERLAAAALAVGIGRAALGHARDYAGTREQFGRRLRQFEGIRAKLANMASRVAAARALMEVAAHAAEPALAAQAKIVASEAAMYVTTEAVQVFGGYGYMRDYPVERLMRDAKATEVLMGTNDGLRTLVVNALYTN